MGINVKGFEYSFASVKLKADDQDIEGLKSIEYSNEIDRGMVRGTGMQVKGMTRGQAKASAKITFSTLGAYQAFIAHLGNGYMERSFDIVVSYREGTETPIITDEVVGCRFKKPQRKAAQGTDSLEVDVDLDVMYCIENGLLPFEGMELG